MSTRLRVHLCRFGAKRTVCGVARKPADRTELGVVDCATCLRTAEIQRANRRVEDHGVFALPACQ